MNVNEKNALNEHVRILLADVFQVPPDEVTPQLAFGDLPQAVKLKTDDRLSHEPGVLLLRLESAQREPEQEKGGGDTLHM